MKASGLQDRLDSGSFLDRYAFIPELNWEEGRPADETVNLLEAITAKGPTDALKAAYEQYRPIYQEEYERHINWEFTEQELQGIVAFLEPRLDDTISMAAGEWRLTPGPIWRS